MVLHLCDFALNYCLHVYMHINNLSKIKRPMNYLKNFNHLVKQTLLFLSLFYLSLYLPLAFLVYTPYWYWLNCPWHGRCEQISFKVAYVGIDELTHYFRHQGELLIRWTDKERQHLAEVRIIYDRLALIALGAGVIFVLTYDHQRVARYAGYNALMILALLLIIPVFRPFWRNIFHALLFDNDLWRNSRQELSYYITPSRFFLFSAVLFIMLSTFLNGMIWGGLRRTMKPEKRKGMN